MSVCMLLAPAHYYRLPCAQWRRHTSVWSDTRSVRSPNDAALHALDRARPLLPLITTNTLTYINVSERTMCQSPVHKKRPHVQILRWFSVKHYFFFSFIKKAILCLSTQTHNGLQVSLRGTWQPEATHCDNNILIWSHLSYLFAPGGGDLSGRTTSSWSRYCLVFWFVTDPS